MMGEVTKRLNIFVESRFVDDQRSSTLVSSSLMDIKEVD